MVLGQPGLLHAHTKRSPQDYLSKALLAIPELIRAHLLGVLRDRQAHEHLRAGGAAKDHQGHADGGVGAALAHPVVVEEAALELLVRPAEVWIP